MVIDLPPGTGDAQLTLCQKANLTGAVLVTTPQQVALLDVKKSLQAFKKLSVPIVGLIENMSYFICPECGHEEKIFGEGATEEGVFHESINFASIHDLPILFICENNFYSVYTALTDRQPDRPLSAYAEAHNMPSAVVDGNDVLAVRKVTREMVARARSGKGPGLIIATTYRWR